MSYTFFWNMIALWQVSRKPVTSCYVRYVIESWDDVLFKPVYVILWPFLVFRFDEIGSMDLHTKSLEVSFVYEISDLYIIGIQSSTLIY